MPSKEESRCRRIAEEIAKIILRAPQVEMETPIEYAGEAALVFRAVKERLEERPGEGR